MADIKYAAYVCSGCGIGDALDVAALEKVAQKEGKMALVKSHPFLCNAEGVQMIRDDIANDGVTHLCIAACSRRAKTEAFNFPTVAMSRANLREGVIWVVAEGSDHDEVRQEMAEDYVRMGCAEVKKMKLPGGNVKESSSKRILVVGGGMSGMTAALAAADAGYEVVIVEKSGAAGRLCQQPVKRVPFSAPYAEPQTTGVAANWPRKVGSHSADQGSSEFDGCRNRRRAGPLRHQGRAGIRCHHRGNGRRHRPGHRLHAPTTSTSCPNWAAVRPTWSTRRGSKPWPRRPTAAPIKRADGKEVKSVVFVQCAGQRDDQRHAPALLLRPLLRHQHQAGDVFQGQQPRHRHRGDVSGSARAGHGRGLLPQRPAEGRDLHQGQGEQGNWRR